MQSSEYAYVCLMGLKRSRTLIPFFGQIKMSEFLPLVELLKRIKLNRWKKINCFFVVNVKCQHSKTVSLQYILTISKQRT